MIRNSQLYRTNPKLSGNLQIDLVLSNLGDQVVVDKIHLRPVTPGSYVVDEDEEIINTPHQFNLREFYRLTRSTFYDTTNQSLQGDWPLYKTLDKNYDDQLWAGTKRGTLYHRPFETLVPLWLDSSYGLRFDITISLPGGRPIAMKSITVDDTTREGRYILDYLEHIRGEECINLNLSQNLCTIRGLDMKSGNMVTRRDYNIPRNIIHRERPLIEFNSLLTNIYGDLEMITPQLINFCLVYDPEDWVEGMSDVVKDTPNFEVSVQVYNRDKGGNYRPLKKRDLYTNHHYVPRPKVDEDQWTTIPNFNALDYLGDWKMTTLVHANKITQTINHWSPSTNPEIIYNVYDGMSAYYEYVNENGERLIYSYRGTIGSAQDPSIKTYDKQAKNHNWTGSMRYGGQKDIYHNLMEAPTLISEGKYFKSLSGFVNGMKFNFKNAGIDDIYLGLMTTYGLERVDIDHPSSFNQVYDRSVDTTAIWWERFDEKGRSLPVNGNYPSEEAKAKYSEYDTTYDVGRFHDMDGSFNELLGLPTMPTNRHHLNDQGLFICMKTQTITDEEGNKKKVLCVIFWCASREMHKSEKGVVMGLPAAARIQEMTPEPLVLGNVMDALKNYTAYYKEKLGKIPDHLKKKFEWLDLINEGLQSIEAPQAVHFTRTIVSKQDHTITPDAEETVPYKKEESNNYVFRHDTPLKPTILDPGVKNLHGQWLYVSSFGRNFLWEKQSMEDETLRTKIYDWSYTGVPPKYPSIGYDPVVLSETTPYGDLVYDYPLKKLQGLPEYKWFDKSRITMYSKYFESEVGVDTHDRATLQRTALEEINKKIPVPFADFTKVEQIYDIKYEIIHIKRVDTGIIYIYRIKFTRHA